MRVSLNTNYNFFKTQNNLNSHRTSNFKTQPLKADFVSFSSNIKTQKVNVDKDVAKFVANSLSTSTSGHRATYGSKTFTPEIVELLTAGVGEYVKEQNTSDRKPRVLIAGDTRKATTESKPLIRDTLLKQGVDVLYIDEATPTPVISLLAEKNDLDLVILLTASHNPWEDGGYNLITSKGAIAPPEVTKGVAQKAVEIADRGGFTYDVRKKGEVTQIQPYETYKEQINSLGIIDWDKIRNSNISIYYDSLQGAGKNVLPKLLKDYNIPVTIVNSKGQEGPNPSDENLGELKKRVAKEKSEIKIGFANDGDADRIGIIDENGNYISPNDVLLITAYHLAKNKGLEGDIVRSQATSSQIDLLADEYGLGLVQTPVGFKYIGEEILKRKERGEEILVAGEESGGLTLYGHVPEKDGIIGILATLDLLAEEKKPFGEIMTEVKESLGIEFKAEQFALKLDNNEAKDKILNRLKDVYFNALEGETTFGDFEIDADKTTEVYESMQRYREGGDGMKIYFTDGSSVLIRKSGTEPKIRGYMETRGETKEQVNANIKNLRTELEKLFVL